MTGGLGRRVAICTAALALATSAAFGQGTEYNGRFDRRAEAMAPDRVIVKWRAETRAGKPLDAQPSTARMQKLAAAAGVNFKFMRSVGAHLEVLQLDAPRDRPALEALLASLRADPAVEEAYPDRRRFAHAAPNDPLYTNQWYLQGEQAAAIRAHEAWDITTGAAGVVVAVLDTGVRFEHPDLLRVAQGGRLLPGFDFVTGAGANDGGGWDTNPADPGDWVDATDKQQAFFADCEERPSSWHGTRVASIVGARTNNAAGVAGISWVPAILPVRVLGKCGGFDSDIIVAMRWAAGIPVTNAPANPHPANIINLSLGSAGPCSVYQSVIIELAVRGVLVVASAGNDIGRAVSEPANCAGVLAVAGLRHIGTKVGFSNVGTQVGIAAPAGNCVNTNGGPCLFSLAAATNDGVTVPGVDTYTDQNNFNAGTSFSAPIVAGAAALMHSVNTRLTPAQTIIRLKQSATTFPAPSGLPSCHAPIARVDQEECSCTTSTCGAGMLNAAAAVAAALRPFVTVTANPSLPAPGQTVTLDGSTSFVADGRTISTYVWTVLSSGGVTPALTGANLATASFVAPTAGNITLRLTVTDSAGAQDSADVTVSTPAVPQSSGGGGALGVELLALAFLWRSAIPRRARRSLRYRPV